MHHHKMHTTRAEIAPFVVLAWPRALHEYLRQCVADRRCLHSPLMELDTGNTSGDGRLSFVSRVLHSVVHLAYSSPRPSVDVACHTLRSQ